MIHCVELKAGDMRCELRPDLGGCVAGLWVGSVPVLRSTGAASMESARQSGSFPLVPFSNRMADANLHWQGRDHALERNFAPEPHAMHGIGWQRQWQVVRQTHERATLRFLHAGDTHWPFSFECEQRFSLLPEALHVSLRIVNTDEYAVPVGLGWHPYLVKRAGAQLAFSAKRMWANDARGLPGRQVASEGLRVVCDTLDINNVFDGVHLNSTGVTLSDELLHVRLSSDLMYLLVSTNASKNFIALEPVSHLTNSFNQPSGTAFGTVTLQPGESMKARMTIEARKIA